MRKSKILTQQPEAVPIKYLNGTGKPQKDETGILDAGTTLCKRDSILHEHWLMFTQYCPERFCGVYGLFWPRDSVKRGGTENIYRGVLCRDLKLIFRFLAFKPFKFSSYCPSIQLDIS